MLIANELDSLPELYDPTNPATRRVFAECPRSLFSSDQSPSSRVDAYVTSEVRLALERDAETQDYEDNKSPSGIPSDTPQCYDFPSRRELEVGETLTLRTPYAVSQYMELSESFAAFFIRQRNSYAPLAISAGLFDTICRQVGVPGSFRDFVLYFGDRETEVEIASCPVTFKRLGSGPKARWEVMCNLRFVEHNDRTDICEPTSQWSLRQSSIFCRHEPNGGFTSWVLVTPSPSMEARLSNLWSHATDPTTVTPFRAIWNLFSVTICNLRPYLVAFAIEVDKHSKNVRGTSPDDTGPVRMAKAEERQILLNLDQKLLSAKLAVQATRSDLESLETMCVELSQVLHDDSRVELERLVAAFHDGVRQVDYSLLRIEQLQLKLRGVTNLVSSFLELSNGYALQTLTRESKKESENMRKLNERMHDLAEKNAHDSATVTVLTILTLIYLPLTVVSNFFSTSFVGTSPSGKSIFVTEDWWILLVSTLPLTFVTLYIWRVWSQIKADQAYPIWWPDTEAKRRSKVSASLRLQSLLESPI